MLINLELICIYHTQNPTLPIATPKRMFAILIPLQNGAPLRNDTIPSALYSRDHIKLCHILVMLNAHSA